MNIAQLYRSYKRLSLTRASIADLRIHFILEPLISSLAVASFRLQANYY